MVPLQYDPRELEAGAGRSSAENGQRNRKKERKCGGSVRFIHYLFAMMGAATAPAPDRCSKGAGNHRPSDTAGSGTGDGLLGVDTTTRTRDAIITSLIGPRPSDLD